MAFTYVSNAERATEVVAEVESTGRRAVAIEADMATPEAVTGAVEQAAHELGGLDILVNNAGIFPNGPLEEVSLAELDHALAVHARAAFLTAQAVSRHMPDGGRIISIGSNLAEQVPGPGITLYAMSKAALSGLSQGLARDLGDRGIAAGTSRID